LEISKRKDAWLGEAYYFWDDLEDAHKWGTKSKKDTGYYEIYKAKINCEDVLDIIQIKFLCIISVSNSEVM